MQDNQQYEQLILQYNQLKNGADNILKMIENEDFDGAITMIKSRESVFLNCKCMRRYLELTKEQTKEADKLFNEIKELELRNINILSKKIEEVGLELKKTQKTEKIQLAYNSNKENMSGNIVNIKE